MVDNQKSSTYNESHVGMNVSHTQEEIIMDMKQLALEIIEGRRLTRADDLSFFKNADLEELTEDDIIRTVAMFRFMNPTAYIRMAAGRNYFLRMEENGCSAPASMPSSPAIC